MPVADPGLYPENQNPNLETTPIAIDFNVVT